MDLKEARYILAIAHYKSIGKAAKALFISQPSLSKYLKNLEQQLGSPLFSRLEQPYCKCIFDLLSKIAISLDLLIIIYLLELMSITVN